MVPLKVVLKDSGLPWRTREIASVPVAQGACSLADSIRPLATPPSDLDSTALTVSHLLALRSWSSLGTLLPPAGHPRQVVIGLAVHREPFGFPMGWGRGYHGRPPRCAVANGQNSRDLFPSFASSARTPVSPWISPFERLPPVSGQCWTESKRST